MYRSRLTFALAMAALAAILLPASADAGGGPDTLWTRTYGGPRGDAGMAVFETADSGFMVIGNTFSFGAGAEDIYLVRTDRNGDTLWTRTYGTPESDQPEGALQTSDGGYLIVGENGTQTTTRGLVLKLSAAGESLWSRYYPQAAVLRDACELSDGRFVVTGTSYDDVWLAQLDSVGEVLWSQQYGGDSPDWGMSVRPTSDGGYIMTGETFSYGAGYNDVWLLKTDEDGDTVWTRTFGGTGPDGGYAVREVADGGYIAVGFSRPIEGGCGVYLIRVDSGGDTLWTRKYRGPTSSVGTSIESTPDNSYIILGGISVADSSDIWLLRVNPQGDTLWTQNIGGPGSESGYSMVLTRDGGLVITGWTSSFGAGGADVYLIKTDSLGNVAVAEPKASPTRAPALSLSCEPNPFRTRTAISLQLTADSPAELAIFDASGRRVWTFTVNREPYTVWDGRDDFGQPLPSGAYFVRCDVAGQHATARIVLQR